MRYIPTKFMWAAAMVVVLFLPGCKILDCSSSCEICHTWEWVQSFGGIGGMVLTPQSEGYTQSIAFDDNGTYTRYKNDSVVQEGTYTIITEQSQLDGNIYQMVVFDGGAPTQAITLLSDSQLILREECYDCFTHSYRR